MSIRIHGEPGHLIVDRWPAGTQVGSRSYHADEYGDHGIDRHMADARALYTFFEQHVSFEYTIKQLYHILKRQFPDWDEVEPPR